MKKFILPAIIFITIIASCTLSCKKDKNNGCKPIHLYYNDSAYYSDFVYDGDRLITAYHKNNNNRLVNTTTFNYGSNGKLSSYSIKDSNNITNYKTELIYNAQNQVEEENYYVLISGILEKSSYWVYEYNAEGFLKKYIYYINTIPPFVNHSVEYLEWDANGNFSKRIYKNLAGVTTDTIFATYDNHPGYYTYDYFVPKKSKNNVLKEIIKPTGGGPATTIDRTYLYNTQGYVTFTVDDGDSLYFKYNCGN